MKYLFFLVIFLLASFDSFSQNFPQREKFRRRVEESVKASRDREHDRRLEEASRLPVPKPAVMNVDVQAVLSKGDFKTFALAKAAEARKVVDGDALWLYVKFKSKLGDYVVTTRDPDDRERLRYTLFAEVGPRGDITALSQYAIQFRKEDLAATELKINLAPGMFGKNKSIPVFLMTSGAAKPGVWNNEFRLTNSIVMPRALTANLASVPLTIDLAGGPAKYKKMEEDYVSVMLRGGTDLTKLPVAGTFFKDSIRLKVVEKLAGEGITPEKVYFSGDDWEDIASTGIAVTKYRRVYATFTYRKAEQCLYGVAEVVENFDFMASKFGEAEIRIEKDLPIPCTGVS